MKQIQIQIEQKFLLRISTGGRLTSWLFTKGEGESERTSSTCSCGKWEKHRRCDDLSEEEYKQMSLQSQEEYEKKRMEKNTGYVCRLPRELTMPLSLKNTSRVN